MKLPKRVKDLLKVNEKYHDLYTKDGDVYVLQIEKDDDKDDDDDGNSRLAEFRNNNIALKKQNAEFKKELDALKKQLEGFDPEMLEAGRKAQERARNDEERRLLAAGRFDDVFELRLRDLKGSYEKKLEESKKLIEQEQQRRNAMRAELRDSKVWSSLSRELSRKNVKLQPSAQDDFMSRALRIFDVNDEGELVALENGQPRLNRESKEYSPEDFIQHIAEEASHLLVGSSTGPNGGQKPPIGSIVEVDARDPNSFGRNIESIAKGKVNVRLR
jgi:hypothetical protein